MSDTEFKIELMKINANFALVHDRLSIIQRQSNQIDVHFKGIDQHLDKIDTRLDFVQDTIESLARSTAEGFIEMDERFDRVDTKLQNQIDLLAERKADRIEVSKVRAQVRNQAKR